MPFCSASVMDNDGDVGWSYIQHSTNCHISIKCALDICVLQWMNFWFLSDSLF